jgi:hypothetical protein
VRQKKQVTSVPLVRPNNYYRAVSIADNCTSSNIANLKQLENSNEMDINKHSFRHENIHKTGDIFEIRISDEYMTDTLVYAVLYKFGEYSLVAL